MTVFPASVLSRLLFNVRIFVVSVHAMAAHNGVYIRSLRRIGGYLHIDADAFRDFEVRRRMSQPSVDCLVRGVAGAPTASTAWALGHVPWCSDIALPRMGGGLMRRFAT
jgi:hypothetical protein